MKKDNISAKNSKAAPNPNYFTGNVKLKDISSSIKSHEQRIYHVTFANGARTKLHYHTGGQVLIVTKGKGSLVIYEKLENKSSNFKIKKTQQTTLNVGDVVYIPTKTLHTHGSINKKQLFSHIAINNNASSKAESKAIWYESDFKSMAINQIK
jgi:quercetin dioxygenase-like cupin family protein